MGFSPRGPGVAIAETALREEHDRALEGGHAREGRRPVLFPDRAQLIGVPGWIVFRPHGRRPG
ncbi:MAG: hypothetical protein AUI58_00685 [Chloroflexi bacterium 13_1_40CM_2_70_6]|nr:MAG: hypothetical protein AUI58_00685 [Chloroflexi bacterium 13_1_40CM_2_70_6]OLE76689.1 MAG: hypothetical protein AUG02_04090 [Chloroflexi bacterium 13_1_20CM_2_70_9]